METQGEVWESKGKQPRFPGVGSGFRWKLVGQERIELSTERL